VWRFFHSSYGFISIIKFFPRETMHTQKLSQVHSTRDSQKDRTFK
jgi:hypothetical protein